jgi:hypothetical protein
MKTMMMVAVSLMMVSGSIASASTSTSLQKSVQAMDPNIPENRVVDTNMDKPCPYMKGGRRDSGAIQTAGVAAPAKASVRSQTVTQ